MVKGQLCLHEELFVAHDKKVGTFTSPHIISIHDRICINGQPIADADFIRLANLGVRWKRRFCKPYDQLSFWITDSDSLLYFKKQGVDLGSAEVQLGV